MFGFELKRKKRKPKVKKVTKYPMEFSKKILMVTFLIALIILCYAMWIQYLIIVKDYQGDTNIVITILTVLGAEIATGTGFYYWKAKAENVAREKRLNITEEYPQGEDYNE
ncbi:hypothetical protein [Sporosarcina sp. FSL W7-1283]|uniref:hypothetical protein n=1 Tax=Sporosarcina sp. FSL W7-1283 TaxID=2921560 RepID=UPI0030FAA9D3